MIGFALPWILGVAVAAVLAISALHLLSVRRPPEIVLPTARFLPERDVRAVSRTRRPSDLLLLVLRVGAILAAGVAAAIPMWNSRARERLVLVVADGGVVRDTAAMRALLPPLGDSRAVFESADSANRADAAALMPIAWRAAAQLSQQHSSIDSIELHLLLSAPARSDAGFAGWRAAWPGRVVTHYPVVETSSRRVVVEESGTQAAGSDKSGVAGAPAKANGAGTSVDDAVIAAFAWHSARISRADAGRTDTVLIVRGGAHSSSNVVVLWPTNGIPSTWRAAAAIDTASALATGGRALIGPFRVTALTDSANHDTSITPIAWWSDGRVAATERRTADGCVRTVAFVSDPGSDILLSTSANALFDRLLAPCEKRVPVAAAALSATDVKEGPLADAERFRVGRISHAGRGSWIVPMLFALSLILLVAEWRVRTRDVAAA